MALRQNQTRNKAAKIRTELPLREEAKLPKGRASINEHEGKKYLRWIYPADPSSGDGPIQIDIYCVLKALGEPPGPIAHTVKKLLCGGQRGKGDYKDDLIGALAAINRAIDQLEEGDVSSTPSA